MKLKLEQDFLKDIITAKVNLEEVTHIHLCLETSSNGKVSFYTKFPEGRVTTKPMHFYLSPGDTFTAEISVPFKFEVS